MPTFSSKIFRSIRFENPGEIIGYLNYFRENQMLSNVLGKETFQEMAKQLDERLLEELQIQFKDAKLDKEIPVLFHSLEHFTSVNKLVNIRPITFIFQSGEESIPVKLNLTYLILDNKKRQQIEEAIQNEFLIYSNFPDALLQTIEPVNLINQKSPP